jgi:hypothetical protein
MNLASVANFGYGRRSPTLAPVNLMVRSMSRNEPGSRFITAASWICAGVAAVLLLICAYGLALYADQVGRRDPSAPSQLGAVLVIFSIAVVLTSPVILRATPRGRVRITVSIVASILIAASWIGGLALNRSS